MITILITIFILTISVLKVFKTLINASVFYSLNALILISSPVLTLKVSSSFNTALLK